MKWFFNKGNKKSAVLFDKEVDYDPWSSSTISFFKSIKNKKNNYQEESINLEEDTFPSLESTYKDIQKKAQKDLEKVNLEKELDNFSEDQPFLNSQISNFSEDLPSPIDPSQRMFDIYDKKLSSSKEEQANHRISSEISSNLQSSKQKHLYSQEIQTNDSSNYRTRNYNRRYWWRNRSFLEIGLFIIIVLLGAAWFFSSVNKRDGVKEDLIIVEAPKNIKLKPTTYQNIVPYQDELIYGKIDDSDKNQQGEHILPKTDFAPEVPEDQLEEENLDIKESNQEEADNYLDYKDESEDGSYVEEEVMDFKEIPPEFSFKSSFPATQSFPDPSKTTNTDTVVSKERLIDKSVQKQQNPINLSEKKNHSNSVSNPITKNKKLTQKKAPLPKKEALPKSLFFLHVGTEFSKEASRQSVIKLRSKHKILGKYGMNIRANKNSNGRTTYKILVGPFKSKTQANRISSALGVDYRVAID